MEDKKKMKTWKKVLLGILAFLLALLLAGYGFYASKMSKMRDNASSTVGEAIADDDAQMLEDNAAMNEATAGLEEVDAKLSEDEIYKDPNVVNILLIGTDERTGTFSENARGDTCLLLSINKKTYAVKLVSFERGMGVPILDGQYKGQWDWLTHTFRYGGADLLMREIRECFKLDVEHYIRINFNTFRAGIEAVGGVEVELTEAEATYFRDGHIKADAKAGVNYLNGEEALAYARLREIDSDWKRIQRQRTVIQAAVNKTTDMSLLELNALVDKVLPLVKTNLTDMKIAELALLLPGLRGVTFEQMTIPAKGTYGSMKGMGGRSLFAVDFDANADILRELLYGVTE